MSNLFTLLPSGSAINRDPFKSFLIKVVVKSLRSFPQFDNVAKNLSNFLLVAIIINKGIKTMVVVTITDKGIFKVFP